MLAGSGTEASAIPSMSVGRSVEGVCWGCEQFTYTPTRQDTRIPVLATTSSATQVRVWYEQRETDRSHCLEIVSSS